jgi:hypothetical protein
VVQYLQYLGYKRSFAVRGGNYALGKLGLVSCPYAKAHKAYVGE